MVTWVKLLYFPRIHFSAGYLPNQKGGYSKSPEVGFALDFMKGPYSGTETHPLPPSLLSGPPLASV